MSQENRSKAKSVASPSSTPASQKMLDDTMVRADRTDLAESQDRDAGLCTTLGPYELLREIGRGGMGIVFCARHLKLNRIVALKMIGSGEFASEMEIHRFHAEAQSAATLDHPGIVPIFEAGCEQGRHFYTMGLVDGPSLSETLDEGPLPPRESAFVAMRIARAVAYAHDCGVIHRDLKPGNILLVPAAEHPASAMASAVEAGLETFPYTPKITDFGLAKQLERDQRLTATGNVLGTPSFMSPEQAAGQFQQVDELSDVYSIGAILFACMTGQPPYVGESHMETLLKVMESDVPSPRAICPRIPRDLETICMKSLAKEPKLRYASAAVLADDLRRFLDQEPIKAKPMGWPQRIWQWARVRPALAVTIVALLLFYTLHLLSVTVLFPPAPDAPVVYDFPMNLWITAVLGFWLSGAAAHQYWTLRQPSSTLPLYSWVTQDALILTLLLSVTAGANSPASVVYFLLVAASALRVRIALVWYVCVLCIAGWSFLCVRDAWLETDSVHSPAFPLFFGMSMVIVALVNHLLLRRLKNFKMLRAGHDGLSV